MSGVMVAGMERRLAERFEYPEVHSQIKHGAKWHGVRVLNISKTGLRFRSDIPYKKGLSLVFGFVRHDAKAEAAVKVDGMILKEYVSRPSDGYGYEYGVKFSPAESISREQFIDSMNMR